eukprot:GHUV01005677.1.p1 GENE.GHUV01005677.1~~GHUV01005677.1.p1  ORF type:complete len:332 (+),score=59.65 GHUV01005677.1:230-1225(+)
MQLHAGQQRVHVQKSSSSGAQVVRAARVAPRRPAVRRLAVRAAAVNGKVVCVGEALFDFLANEKGVPRSKVKSWTPYPGGAPCNVATCLTKLGVPTAFVSAIGNDDRGSELMKLMKEIGVDTSTVQRVDAPTRDIYVERTKHGDRVFAGFGLPSEQYCDCFLDEEKLPKDALKDCDIMVTGTLGLAAPKTRAAMHTAAKLVKSGGGKVFVDVNWRPVFWEDTDAAKKIMLEFMDLADVVKISDADLEYLYDMQFVTALLNPCSVADKLPNAPAVLVTAGDEGAAYCCRSTKGEHTGFVPVFKVGGSVPSLLGDLGKMRLSWTVFNCLVFWW